jgi:hypothetical protein
MENNPTCKVFTAMRMIKRKLISYTRSSFCVPENVGVNQKIYSQDKYWFNIIESDQPKDFKQRMNKRKL